MQEFERIDVKMIVVEPTVRVAKKNAPKPKRGQANKRERVRTENVNVGFDRLRKLIPTDPEDRKLSKIEVLRLATSYINHLYNLTKANSCIEAQALKEADPVSSFDDTSDSYDGDDILIQQDHKESGQDSNEMSRPKNVTRFKRQRRHVCTFCLMMTKTSTPTPVLTKRK